MKPTTQKEKILTLKGLAKDYGKEDQARELLESIRWADCVCCPRCGSTDVIKVEPNAEKKIRRGLYRCRDCRKANKNNQFTVTVGTIFEDSHIGPALVTAFVSPLGSKAPLRSVSSAAPFSSAGAWCA